MLELELTQNDMNKEFQELVDSIDLSKRKSTLSEVVGASRSLAISQLFSKLDKTILLICENNYEAETIYKEIGFFSDVGRDNLFYIPDTETLPYDQESPHSGLISERARAFHDLAIRQKNNRIVITSISNVIRRTSSISHWKEEFISISKDEEINISSIKNGLLDLGYKEVDLEVSSSGQFCIKNSIIDIFPVGMETTKRIRLDGLIVKSIQNVNVNTQRSDVFVDSLTALSAREIPVDSKAIDKFRSKYRRSFGRALGEPLYESVIAGELPSGIEYYLPLFQDETSTLFDYLPNENDTLIVINGDVDSSLNKNWEQINKRYDELQKDKSKRLLPPNDLWVEIDEYSNKLEKYQILRMAEGFIEDSSSIGGIKTNIERKQNINETVEQLSDWIENADKVVFCLHSEAREAQLRVICEIMGEDVVNEDGWSESMNSTNKLSLITAPIDNGFYLKDQNIALITEKEIFGQPIFAKNEDNLEDAVDYESIQDLRNLDVGDPIVHIKFGVGRYKGLTVMQIGGIDREYLQIGYAESASGFVPMDELNMVSRYGGINNESTPLDIMGSEKWLKGLHLAMEDIDSTAHSLIKAQSMREMKEGIQFDKPTFKFQRFCREFPFQETRDQKRAVSDIIKDMTSPRPMDRTVVGDVGFGKTEVAMRAVFLAFISGYQSAIMVPTTLLAQQHFENFKERFASFDVNIKCLSRFDKKTEKETLAEIKSGKVDIVIGTHKLIQDDVIFKNIGLLVIDEEHRFGVKHKDKMRKMREGIDVLSMTATPIPRTLSMSLNGIKDLSVIATPPAKRLSIRTIVETHNNEIVVEAIQRELMRNGQVFFLHNSIATIEKRAKEIERLIPGIRVGIGHGRMGEMKLEKVMESFYKKEFDILVCTTIIETGIDVPNANTIIIDNADRLGIAQLHQLRGRVGRSHHQAYAYLLSDSITDTSISRLKAMEEATNLGEGFVLANHDLEIRGAGELLGEEQSGHIQSIGFTIYMRLLERGIEILKAGGNMKDLYELRNTKLDINISGLIDKNYIENQQARLSMYKRLASVDEIAELDSIQDEMEDRFGHIPNSTMDLVDISKLRCYLKQIGIKKLVANNEGGVIELANTDSISVDKLFSLIQDEPNSYSPNGPYGIRFKKNTKNRDERFDYLISLITELAH